MQEIEPEIEDDRSEILEDINEEQILEKELDELEEQAKAPRRGACPQTCASEQGRASTGERPLASPPDPVSSDPRRTSRAHRSPPCRVSSP